MLSLAVNRDLLAHLSTALPGNAGDPMLNAWILGWVSDAVVTAPTSLWQAPIFHPHANTLAFSEHLLGIAAVVAPVYWLTGDAVLTYNVAFLLGYAFLGFSAFMLVRALTGCREAAAVAGVLLLCSPYFVSSQVARLQMLSAGWSLLALRWLHAWLSDGRRRALAAVVGCWVAQFLSNTYLGLFLIVPLGLLLMADAVRRRGAMDATRLAHLALAALIAVSVAVPVLTQYARARTEIGLTHSDDEVRRYSATVRAYASVWHERAPAWLWADESSDRALFPGWALVGLGLAGVAMALGRGGAEGRPPMGGVYVAIAVVTFVVTLGPAPAVVEAPLGMPSPYAWLLASMPGVDGIRSPGRFAVFVILAWTVLAGIAAAHLLRGRHRLVRLAVVGLLGTAALIEGRREYDWLAVLPVEAASADAAYDWLAAQPAGAVLEMPVVTAFQGQRPYAGGSVTLRYQLAALRHRHPLVNGASGFVTPFVTLLQSHASPFTTLDTVDDALRALRAIGTRYILQHRHEYLSSALGHVDGVQQTIRGDSAQVEAVHTFGTTTVFVLRPGSPATPAPRRPRLGRAHYSISASTGPGTDRSLTDDDPSTRWRAPQDGGAWIELQLHRARVLHGVKLDAPRHAVVDYPHHLRVVGTDTNGDDHVLFDGPAAYDAALTSLFEPADPGLRLLWPPLALARVRLEQPVPAGNRQWTVHDLHLLTDGELAIE